MDPNESKWIKLHIVTLHKAKLSLSCKSLFFTSLNQAQPKNSKLLPKQSPARNLTLSPSQAEPIQLKLFLLRQLELEPARYTLVWYGMIWYGMVWYGMVVSCYMFGYVWVCWDMFGYVCVCLGVFRGYVENCFAMLCSMLNENILVNFEKTRGIFGYNLSLGLKAVLNSKVCCKINYCLIELSWPLWRLIYTQRSYMFVNDFFLS